MYVHIPVSRECRRFPAAPPRGPPPWTEQILCLEWKAVADRRRPDPGESLHFRVIQLAVRFLQRGQETPMLLVQSPCSTRLRPNRRSNAVTARFG